MEFYKKYRPRSLKTVIGNEETVASLQNMVNRGTVPHTILFYGPSGCGKTTLGRILKKELDCSDMDFREMNCSDFRGIDTIREIARNMNLAPTAGSCRIWLLDEFQNMSKDGQNAALKMMEDTPSHVYFFICTTDPQKLLKAIQTRCTKMPVDYLKPNYMIRLLKRIVKREELKISDDILEDIADASSGSARNALVILDKIANLPESKWGSAITSIEDEKEGIEICRALFNKVTWSTMSKLIKEVKGDPETIRWSVLGYAKAILLNKGDAYACHVIHCFEDNFYDSKEAGLVAACYEALCN